MREEGKGELCRVFIFVISLGVYWVYKSRNNHWRIGRADFLKKEKGGEKEGR